VKRALIITSIAIAILAVLGGVAFTFGTPQAPDVATQAAASGAVSASAPDGISDAVEAAGGVAAADVTADAQAVPEPDPNAPLAIEIPGCRCHSDDPKIVEEHSTYRMNQCAGCHGGKTPTGQ